MIIQDIILVAVALGVMSLGFFIMKRLDKFLDGNRKRIEKEEKKKCLSCEMLTTDLTDEELVDRIRTYEKRHGSAHIVLYRNEDELYDELFKEKM